MADKKERLVFLAKHGPENAELATIPFAMALGAMISEIDAVVVLQSNGVLLALRGAADHVFAPGMTGLPELVDLFVSDGGKVLVCSACITSRKIREADLIDQVELGSVSSVTKEFSEAANVITY